MRDSEPRTADELFREADRLEEGGEYQKAYALLLIAAQRNHFMSQINLGNMLAFGTGVRKDSARAVYWYRRAYLNGSSIGARNLAIEKRNQGNTRSAVAWFKRAIALHDSGACIDLAKLYLSMRGRRPDAARLLRKALRMRRDPLTVVEREEVLHLLRRIRG